jgi:hypothetical protein
MHGTVHEQGLQSSSLTSDTRFIPLPVAGSCGLNTSELPGKAADNAGYSIDLRETIPST